MIGSGKVAPGVVTQSPVFQWPVWQPQLLMRTVTVGFVSDVPASWTWPPNSLLPGGLVGDARQIPVLRARDVVVDDRRGDCTRRRDERRRDGERRDETAEKLVFPFRSDPPIGAAARPERKKSTRGATNDENRRQARNVADVGRGR